MSALMLCACGCGKTFTPHKTNNIFIRFINGHRSHSSLDNTQDMVKKGRLSNRTGDNNPKARLTANIVAKIREEYAISDILQVDLAAKYNITPPHLSQILHHKSW